MIANVTEILTQSGISGKFSSGGEARMDKQTSGPFDKLRETVSV
jgi:hypothetical protein